ncbi:hypothetical protein [Vibrio fluvialis]|uniref:hypothetical protein n=1 Tax=Vibrio fluvialis TaxID=676 RepID=UPI0023A9C63C|nr:hypothetical protein [Vibrio fluvialis]MDE5179002.1 hypothetical protein [Vibrio fluvialis]
MRLIGCLLLLTLSHLTFAATSGENKQEEWSLDVKTTCKTMKLSLPMPELNATCDLDKTSGNPSKWFNPLATCELEFDMIGLPSLGDIMSKAAGSVCNAIKGVKEHTVDQAIDEANKKLENNGVSDIDASVDLNDWVEDKITDNSNSSTSGDNTSSTGNQTSGSNSNICYTKDLLGNTVTVPCDITETTATNSNQCYLKTGSAMEFSYSPVACDRPTINYETCVTGYSKDEQGRVRTYSDGVPIPETGSCGNTVLASRNNACIQTTKVNGISGTRIVECNRLSEPVTQINRMCSGSTTDSSGGYTNVNRCIEVDETCYGHKGGMFQAAQCRDFTTAYLYSQQKSGSQSSTSSSNGGSNAYSDFTW